MSGDGASTQEPVCQIAVRGGDTDRPGRQQQGRRLSNHAKNETTKYGRDGIWGLRQEG